MRIKGYRYNPDTLSYDVQVESRWIKILRVTLYVIGSLALAFGYYMFYTRVLDLELPKTALLRVEKSGWDSKIDVLSRQLDYYERTLSGIEERNDHVYRALFGLGEISVSGCDSNLVSKVADLERRCVVQSVSLDSISLMTHQAGDMISHVPAVSPICPVPGSYHLSSLFGRRLDPIHGWAAFHEGLDIATKKGVPVYCTADGTVERVEIQFRGYGRQVIVNHGFGYRTRYAHLNRIDVLEGDALKRGDMIGTVGNSGKSTGPHLHYEVEYRGKKVNPINYLDFQVSVHEYKAMVSKRKAELKKPDDTRITASDILRRRERR